MTLFIVSLVEPCSILLFRWNPVEFYSVVLVEPCSIFTVLVEPCSFFITVVLMEPCSIFRYRYINLSGRSTELYLRNMKLNDN